MTTLTNKHNGIIQPIKIKSQFIYYILANLLNHFNPLMNDFFYNFFTLPPTLTMSP